MTISFIFHIIYNQKMLSNQVKLPSILLSIYLIGMFMVGRGESIRDSNATSEMKVKEDFCNSRGTYDDVNKQCICESAFAGIKCEVECTNKCSSNGACKADGSCVCEPGWESDDCSISVSYKSLLLNSLRLLVNIYISVMFCILFISSVIVP